MDDEIPQARTLALMVLLALWCAAWVYSVVYFLNTDLTGVGLSRVSGFMGWQGVAGMLAFAAWGVGLGFPKESGIRRTSAVPLGMALALILLVVGIAIWGRFTQP